MSLGLCPCGWIHTKGSEWRCAKCLEHAIAENNKNKNDPSNKNNPTNENGHPNEKNDHPTKEPARRRQRTQEPKSRGGNGAAAKHPTPSGSPSARGADPRAKWGRFWPLEKTSTELVVKAISQEVCPQNSPPASKPQSRPACWQRWSMPTQRT
jgi:hypothetical protein